jgi:hypothetical protein
MSFTPPPQPKPGRTTRTVLIVVGVVLAVCCLGGIGFAKWGISSVQDSVKPAHDAADSYLGKVQAGDFTGAHAQLCTATQERLSQSAFVASYTGQPKLRSYKITNTSVVNRNGRVSATVQAHLVTDSGLARDEVLRLVKLDDNSWRVCPTG